MSLFNRTLLMFFITLCGVGRVASAQKVTTVQSIFDQLSLVRPGYAVVHIHQSPAIRQLVGRRPMSMSGDSIPTIRGYRVQIFSGNRSNSKHIAQDREAQIKEMHPELMTYVIYEAPFWKLRVGNYLSSDAAQTVLLSLKKEFPKFGKEMYIVRDKVLIQQPVSHNP